MSWDADGSVKAQRTWGRGVGTLLCVSIAALVNIVTGCGSTIPSSQPVASESTTSGRPTASAPLEPAPSETITLVADALGVIHFNRPTTWSWTVPSSSVIPGVVAWLSSVPLTEPCPQQGLFPASCVAPGGLPEGTVVIEFGTGATLSMHAKGPTPLQSYLSVPCTAIGGDRSLSTRLGTTYINACVRGAAGETAFRAFIATITRSD